MTSESFVELLGREKATAILRTNSQEKATLAMEAAIRGGFKIIEFTLTIPCVFDLVQDFSQREGLVAGTGTVMDKAQAQEWIDAGVFAVGFVAPLFPADDVEAARWDAIEARAQRCLSAVAG